MSTLNVENIKHPSSSTPAITLDSTGAMSGSFPYPNRNLIYNGAMQVHQRGTSMAGIAGTGYFTADRWRFSYSSAGIWTHTIEDDAPSGTGLSKSLKILCTTSDNSLGVSDYVQLQQRLEGQDVQRLCKGTSEAKDITLSFWVKTNVSGTYIFTLIDNDNNRYISSSFIVSLSDTWEYKTITIPGDTVGVLNNDNGLSLNALIWLAAGSNYTSGVLQTSWNTTVAANYAVGQTNLAAATNNYWQITGVQLETGSIATEFEFEPYGTTLAKCQRYFIVLAEGNSEYIAMGQSFSDNGYGIVRFPNIMRAAPSSMSYSNLSHFTAWDAGTSSKTPLTLLQMDSATPRSCRLPWQASGVGTSAMTTLRTNNSSAYIWISAEL